MFGNNFFFSTSATLPLDILPMPEAAYSIRKLKTAYTGSVLRVRRSNDNAEQDIGFVGNELDTTSLLSFVGANNGFVTTWYDQSGNARHATQSTAANQPTIVSGGVLNTNNGKPSIALDGINDFLNCSIFSATEQNINVFAVAKGGSSTAFSKSSILGTADGFIFNLRSTSQVRNTGGTAILIPSTGASDVLGVYSFILGQSGATLPYSVFLNGVLNSSASPAGTGHSTNYPTYIGRGDGGAGTTTSNASIAELIVLTTAITDTDRQTIERNQGAYYGI
jgi:hypothetical protein